MLEKLSGSEVADDVLGVVYDVALDPGRYESLAAAWAEDLWPHIPVGSSLAMEASVMSHFARAEAILDQIQTRFETAETKDIEPHVEAFGATAALVFNDQHEVTATNDAGVRLLSAKVGAKLSELAISAQDAAALDLHMRGMFDQGRQAQSFLRVRHQNNGQLIIVQLRLVDAGRGKKSVVAITSDIHWPEHFREWLGRAYDLSEAECEIVRHIVDCKSVSEIATSRGRTVGTVRNQIKSILAKTGSRTQTELVRLAMSIMEVSVAKDMPLPTETVVATNRRLPVAPHRSVTGPDGRRLDYLVLGDPDGTPVFFLQTELGLTRLPAFIEADARKRGLCILSPIRAGFGYSDPVPPDANFAQQVAQDLLTVIDHEGIKTLPVISMAADNTFAGYMHGLRPGSVSAIIATSGCFPFITDDQAARQHHMHRLMHSTARYFPQLLPFVAKASFAYVRKMGKASIIKMIFKNAPPDLKIFEHPDVRDAVLEGSDVALSDQHSAHEAFIRQCLSYHDPNQLTLLPRLHEDGVPYHSLNGLQDPSMHADTVAENQERYPWITFHIYPEAGQWLFFQYPDDVFDLVEPYARP